MHVGIKLVLIGVLIYGTKKAFDFISSSRL